MLLESASGILKYVSQHAVLTQGVQHSQQRQLMARVLVSQLASSSFTVVSNSLGALQQLVSRDAALQSLLRHNSAAMAQLHVLRNSNREDLRAAVKGVLNHVNLAPAASSLHSAGAPHFFTGFLPRSRVHSPNRRNVGVDGRARLATSAPARLAGLARLLVSRRRSEIFFSAETLRPWRRFRPSAPHASSRLLLHSSEDSPCTTTSFIPRPRVRPFLFLLNSCSETTTRRFTEERPRETTHEEGEGDGEGEELTESLQGTRCTSAQSLNDEVPVSEEEEKEEGGV